MPETYATAPGVFKLYGEHVVLHGKPSAAMAAEMRAKVAIYDADSDGIEFELKDLGKSEYLPAGHIKTLFLEYREATSGDADRVRDFVARAIGDVSAEALPYIIIAGRLMDESNTTISGKKVIVSSDIPMSKGLASSAACSVAFTMAMAKCLGIGLADEKLIDIARDGERIVHKNRLAGKIDVNASFYGGCVVYSDQSGVVRENLPKNIRILIVDTGPKKPTSETVRTVSERLEMDRAGTMRIFDMIEECTTKGISALRTGDLIDAGRCMYRNQELLKELGVSNPGLDAVVAKSKELGASGSKLSGGGGGGIAIVLSDDPARLSREFTSTGLKVYNVSMAESGAAAYIKR
jgi:mevalonate kinase